MQVGEGFVRKSEFRGLILLLSFDAQIEEPLGNLHSFKQHVEFLLVGEVEHAELLGDVVRIVEDEHAELQKEKDELVEGEHSSMICLKDFLEVSNIAQRRVLETHSENGRVEVADCVDGGEPGKDFELAQKPHQVFFGPFLEIGSLWIDEILDFPIEVLLIHEKEVVTNEVDQRENRKL